MKYLFGLAVMLLASGGRYDDITSIEIFRASLDIHTRVSIPCKRFDEVFNDEKKKITIRNRNRIRHFMEELSTLQMDTGRYPDTRAKIFIKYKSHTDTLCADRFTIQHKNNFYILSDALRRKIW